MRRPDNQRAAALWRCNTLQHTATHCNTLQCTGHIIKGLQRLPGLRAVTPATPATLVQTFEPDTPTTPITPDKLVQTRRFKFESDAPTTPARLVVSEATTPARIQNLDEMWDTPTRGEDINMCVAHLNTNSNTLWRSATHTATHTATHCDALQNAYSWKGHRYLSSALQHTL